MPETLTGAPARGAAPARRGPAVPAAAPAAPTGTQSVERAISLLRILARRDAGGARLVDVVADSGLNKPTVRRLLLVLMREGLVDQDPGSRRYHLGVETFALGSVAAERFGIRKIAAPAVLRIAEASGDTAYLSVRSGFDAICVERQEGAFPIRTLTLAVGDRRPLGVGAGSLALLAFQPDLNEVRSIIDVNAGRVNSYAPRFEPQRLLTLVDQTRSQGYAFNDGLIVAGMSAVAVPILNRRGEPEAALSIAAIDSRMTPERRAQLVALLQRERERIEQQLGRTQSPGARDLALRARNRMRA
ncbi:IclR family transcriptional regulator [Tistrella mobilis]|uniref:IclR family regulatory protein n=1 Tax=Tistrella mobilis (strain KA081020-065) TaxID=1110502 RepID=I3TXL2_TISMK|nr:IclR family transcriptional regulator [Tistrella mobilis]AFK57500.1 IclR family regulatory protein [Tistrella mobilis KA081020-065]MAM72637.1 IclR family transcriptional regulator [Tistrella sp.]